MIRLCLLSLTILACQVVCSAQEDAATPTRPPVLRSFEPTDNVVVTLPGPPPAWAPVPNPVSTTEVHLAPPPADPARPFLRRPDRQYPPEFEHDSADYLGQQIGIWQQIDAQELLGEPTGQRPAFAEDQTVNGQIVSFPDPTTRYKQLELDFDRETGLLRTLFVYPQNMTWNECRKEFGMNVKATQANKGRTFYSYLDRRLDILVDAEGKVISLGMY